MKLELSPGYRGKSLSFLDRTLCVLSEGGYLYFYSDVGKCPQVLMCLSDLPEGLKELGNELIIGMKTGKDFVCIYTEDKGLYVLDSFLECVALSKGRAYDEISVSSDRVYGIDLEAGFLYEWKQFLLNDGFSALIGDIYKLNPKVSIANLTFYQNELFCLMSGNYKTVGRHFCAMNEEQKNKEQNFKSTRASSYHSRQLSNFSEFSSKTEIPGDLKRLNAHLNDMRVIEVIMKIRDENGKKEKIEGLFSTLLKVLRTSFGKLKVHGNLEGARNRTYAAVQMTNALDKVLRKNE